MVSLAETTAETEKVTIFDLSKKIQKPNHVTIKK